MPLFNFPNKKLREQLHPIIKEASKKAKYDKEKDPVYQAFIKRFDDFKKDYDK